MNTLNLPQQEIALRAYHLYLDGGRANGHDWDHWLQAEQEVGARYFVPPIPRGAASAPSGGKAPVVKAASAAKAAPAAKKTVKKAAAKKAPAKKATPKK
jgi:hypothetical protein